MQEFRKLSPFRLSSLLRLERDPKTALHLFLNPDPDPNSKPFPYSALSYDLILTKLGRARMFPEMEQIIHKLRNDVRIIPQEIIFCNIITYYGRSLLPHKALQVFDQIPSFRCQRTIKSVNTLLNSLLMCREFAKMRELLSRIEQYASPDTCTYNILIHACCITNDLGNALQVFDEMSKRGIKPNVVTYGTLIHGLCANLKIDEAFRLKKGMEKKFGLIPNAHIYIVLIKGLCRIGELGRAIELKNKMLKKKKVQLDPAVYSTLITAFFREGRRCQIPELLEEMKRNGCKPDTVMYNAVIHGFCQEKDIDSAFRALNEMEKVGCKADVITYNIIIAGLCRAGKVSEGQELLEDMPRRKCSPDVVTYRTVFDGLCDAQRFEDAASLLEEMIFIGYTRSCCSVSKNIVEGLVGGKKMELWAYVVHVVKRNCADRSVWRLMVSLSCKGDNGDAGKLFNSLIKPSSFVV